MFPCRLDAELQLRHAHVLRLEDHVLRIVELPVAREDAPFRVEPLEERCIREGRHDREAREVDLRLNGELGRLEEDIRLVLIEPEDEAALERDAVRVEPLDDAAVVLRCD